MIAIILHSPEHPGNVGAVARVMKNFGFTDLVLINPQCDHLCDEARNRAKHAREVLENATVGDEKLLASYDYLAATSGKLGSDYNIPRIPLDPKQFSHAFAKIEGTLGVLFGRESSGLTNEELAQADFLVTIPTNDAYPILNLSHAVSIVLYELSQQDYSERYPVANRRQKEEMAKHVQTILDRMDFATEDKRNTQEIMWHRIIGSSFLSRREAQALIGFFKKLAQK